jgi:hypothetical protein
MEIIVKAKTVEEALQLGAEKLGKLQTKDAGGNPITHLMTKDEYKAKVYKTDANGNQILDDKGNPILDVEGVGYTVKNVLNYIIYFVEILCNYPVETLANGLPTVAYFLYADGIS